MKLLIKKLANTNLGVKIRNLLSIRPVHMSIQGIKKSSSVSDAFCWRKGFVFFGDFIKQFWMDKIFLE